MNVREALADDLGVLSDAEVGDGLVVQRQRVGSRLGGAERPARDWECVVRSGERGPEEGAGGEGRFVHRSASTTEERCER